MSTGDGFLLWIFGLILGIVIGATVERAMPPDADALLAEQQVRVEALTTALRRSNQHAVALQDSVLAGTIEGFGLRCYLVREE